MSPVAGIPSDVQNIAGPLIITFMLGSILYGMQVLQVYTYYLSFPKDRKVVKYLVYIVFFLDTTQTAIFFRDAFTFFGSGFGDVVVLRSALLSGFSVPIMTGLISLMVQSFYCFQIQVISRSWILPSIIFSVAITQFVASIIEGVLIFRINNSAILQQRTPIPCTIWLAGSALCDTIIAITMTFYLLQAGSGLQGNVLITRLVRLVIETGSLTASVAIIDAVLFAGVQNYPFHMIPSRCLAKLYSNSLMVILNSRIRIQGGRNESTLSDEGWSQSVEPIRFASLNALGLRMRTQHSMASLAGSLGEPSSTGSPRRQDTIPQIHIPLGNMNIENQEDSKE